MASEFRIPITYGDMKPIISSIIDLAEKLYKQHETEFEELRLKNQRFKDDGGATKTLSPKAIELIYLSKQITLTLQMLETDPKWLAMHVVLRNPDSTSQISSLPPSSATDAPSANNLVG